MPYAARRRGKAGLAARRLFGNVALANGLFLLARGNAPGLQRVDAGDQSDLHQKIQGVVVRRRNASPRGGMKRTALAAYELRTIAATVAAAIAS